MHNLGDISPRYTSLVNMPPNSRGLGSYGSYSAGNNPVLAISGFRPKEKYLIFLVLATFGFVCFAAVFFLPDKLDDDKARNANKVYRVYKELQDVGRDFILPAPPVATLSPGVKSGTGKDPESVLELSPNVRHGVHGVVDKHKIEDKARLLAQVELDEQINELRKKQQQQVLPKPHIIKPHDPIEEDVSKGERGGEDSGADGNKHAVDEAKQTKETNRGDKPGVITPVIVGGEDPSALDKRNHVKGVSTIYFDKTLQESFV